MKRLYRVIKNMIYKLRSFNLTDEDYALRVGVKFGKNCILSTRLWGSEPYLIEIGDHVHVEGAGYTHHDENHQHTEKQIAKVLVAGNAPEVLIQPSEDFL